MRELLEGIKFLPCIRTIILRNNEITDEYSNEIVEIFSNVRIRCIDLSFNRMGKKIASMISKKMKDEVGHILWLEYRLN